MLPADHTRRPRDFGRGYPEQASDRLLWELKLPMRLSKRIYQRDEYQRITGWSSSRRWIKVPVIQFWEHEFRTVWPEPGKKPVRRKHVLAIPLFRYLRDWWNDTCVICGGEFFFLEPSTRIKEAGKKSSDVSGSIADAHEIAAGRYHFGCYEASQRSRYRNPLAEPDPVVTERAREVE